jgi:hypothetical protein
MIDDRAFLSTLTTMFPDYTFGIKPIGENGRILTIDGEVAKISWMNSTEALDSLFADDIKESIDQAVVDTIMKNVLEVIKRKKEEKANEEIPELCKCPCGKTPKVSIYNEGHGGHGAEPDQARVICECGLMGKAFYDGYDKEYFPVMAAEWWNYLFC